jgi:hypothetical protein
MKTPASMRVSPNIESETPFHFLKRFWVMASRLKEGSCMYDYLPFKVTI